MNEAKDQESDMVASQDRAYYLGYAQGTEQAKRDSQELSVAELCANHENLREYISQLEAERDILAAIGRAARDDLNAREACWADDDSLRRNLRSIAYDRLRASLTERAGHLLDALPVART